MIPTYTLVIHYWADGEQAGPDFRGTYSEGASYNVLTPVKNGYNADQSSVTGVITGETEINVFYTKQVYTLTVKFHDLNGREMTDSLIVQMQTGDTYRLTAPEFDGYEALTPVVEATMGNQNKEVIVYYTETAGTTEDGRKIYTITGQPSEMINDYMTPLGLHQVNRGHGETIE